MPQKKYSAKKAAILGVIIGLVANFAIVALVLRWMPPRELAQKTIRVGYSPYALNLPIFVAKELELFGDRTVEMIPFQTTDSMLTALIRGDVDLVSAIGTERLILANSNSQDTVVARAILFNAFRKDRWTEAILVANERDDLTSVKDLDGKSIATLPAATAVAYCRLIAEAEGIAFSSILQINPTEALGALASGRFDALLAVEPQITFARGKNLSRVLVEAPVAKFLHDPMLVGAHCIQEGRAKSDPEFSDVCYRALADAAAFAKDRPLEALGFAAKYIEMPDDLLRNTQLPDWIPAGEVQQEDLDFLVDAFVGEGILVDFAIPDALLYVPRR